jgi:hypothetical protein
MGRHDIASEASAKARVERPWVGVTRGAGAVVVIGALAVVGFVAIAALKRSMVPTTTDTVGPHNSGLMNIELYPTYR